MEKIKVDVDVLSDAVRSLKEISQHIGNISNVVSMATGCIAKDDIGNDAVHGVFQEKIGVLRKNSHRVEGDINKHSAQLEQIVMNFRKEVDSTKKQVCELDPGNIGW